MLQTIQKNWDKLQVGYFSQKNFRGPQTPHFVDTDLSKFSLRNWKTNLPKFLVILGWISFRESEFLGKISLELIFENWSKIVFRGSPTEIFSEWNVCDLKKSEKIFCRAGPSSRRFLAYFCSKLAISRNFGRFVFQFLSENLLKSVSTKWGVCGPRNFFLRKVPNLKFISFFRIVCSIFIREMAAKWSEWINVREGSSTQMARAKYSSAEVFEPLRQWKLFLTSK